MNVESSGARVLESSEPLAVLAGGGTLPVVVATAAERAGRPVKIIGINGEADDHITNFTHEWVDWGDIGRLLITLRADKVTDLVMVGRIHSRPDYRSMQVDRAGEFIRGAVAGLFSGGDNAVLSGAVKLFESRGFRILGAHEIATELVAPAGSLTKRTENLEEKRDVVLAMEAAKTIGALDIGQAAVAVDARVIALEGAEGTDAMLERVARLKEVGRVPGGDQLGVLSKCAKPHQDLRIDMPTIGPGTVKAAVAAGLAGIAIEAGRVMIAEREETIHAADSAGIFITGVEDASGTTA